MWWIAVVAIIAIVVALAAKFLKAENIIYPYRDLSNRLVKSAPFLDRIKNFPSARNFEANWEAIRDEILAVIRSDAELPQFSDIDPTQKPLTNYGGVPWYTYMLMAYGNWVENNATRCPLTSRLIRQDPRITTAMFSIIPGGKEIPPHRGLFKGVLRYHLGLKTPRSEGCYILVGGEKYSWKEGEGVLFDDTFLHEVKNTTDELRIVLFLDVVRQDSPAIIRLIDRGMYQMAKNSRRAQAAARRAETFKPAVTN